MTSTILSKENTATVACCLIIFLIITRFSCSSLFDSGSIFGSIESIYAIKEVKEEFFYIAYAFHVLLAILIFVMIISSRSNKVWGTILVVLYVSALPMTVELVEYPTSEQISLNNHILTAIVLHIFNYGLIILSFFALQAMLAFAAATLWFLWRRDQFGIALALVSIHFSIKVAEWGMAVFLYEPYK